MTHEKTHTMLFIPKIEEGIVIDHIPVGRGVLVLEVIRSYPELHDIVVTLGLNYTSTKLGRKDMVKLGTKSMPEKVLEHISLISPGISIKRIVDYEVDQRFVLRPPSVISRLARCRNPNCVTHHERHLTTRFRRLADDSTRYRCEYCERVFDLKELEVAQP
jgi:aspartate carbamoyltransferase regulatory subunit